MRIKVERSGGYAGRPEQLAALDTEQLEPDAAAEIERLVHQMGFFELPGVLPGSDGADRFRYEVSVTDGGREHTVVYADSGESTGAPVQRLVRALGGAG
jgi:Emfourin